MARRPSWQTSVTMLALAGLVVTLLYVPAASTAPGDVADLEVIKADTPDPVLVGAPLTYTIRVANLGPQAATGVVVTDEMPSQTIFVSASTTSGNCERKGRRVTCNIGNLAADATKANAVTVTVQVQPRKVGTIENTASVDSIENDPVTANDRSTTSTQVTEPAQAFTCRGVPATHPGTLGPDRMVGTAGPDVIVARAGADTIFGLSGRDLICAGAGRDRVTAGPAADRVFAGPGPDRVRGRGGPDLLAGNRGADVLSGNAGSDRLRGGEGFDFCIGGAGFDVRRGCER
jgi:uncharacterized repeat protein (TIGR01451 family)